MQPTNPGEPVESSLDGSVAELRNEILELRKDLEMVRIELSTRPERSFYRNLLKLFTFWYVIVAGCAWVLRTGSDRIGIGEQRLIHWLGLLGSVWGFVLMYFLFIFTSGNIVISGKKLKFIKAVDAYVPIEKETPLRNTQLSLSIIFALTTAVIFLPLYIDVSADNILHRTFAKNQDPLFFEVLYGWILSLSVGMSFLYMILMTSKVNRHGYKGNASADVFWWPEIPGEPRWVTRKLIPAQFWEALPEFMFSTSASGEESV